MSTAWGMKTRELSTAHLPPFSKEDVDTLSESVLVRHFSEGHGFTVFTGGLLTFDESDEPFEQALYAACQWAKRHANDCGWLRFDADGDEVEGLPTFNWEDRE